MNWIELTALDNSKTLVFLDRVDYISTGYELPGCMIHFTGGLTRSVQEEMTSITKTIKKVGAQR